MTQFKPDVIHTHSMYGPGLEAALYAKMSRTPLVGTNHTPVSEFLPGVPQWLIKIVLRYTSWYYDLCSFVSAPCQALLDEMKQYGMKTRQSPVPNPVELDAFSAAANEKEKADYKQKFGLSKHAVLYTGRLSGDKRINILIDAVIRAQAEIPDISLAITGKGTMEKTLRAQAEASNIADHIKFLGYVANADFPGVYKAADIFSIMSVSDTQSLSLMQAFATGLPAIVARAWGLPEYVHDEGTDAASGVPDLSVPVSVRSAPLADGIVLEPDDVDGLARTLIALFKNPERMKKLGGNGIKHVKLFSPELIADRWEEIYKTAIL